MKAWNVSFRNVDIDCFLTEWKTFQVSEVTWIDWPIESSFGSFWVADKNFSFLTCLGAAHRLSTRAANLLFFRSRCRIREKTRFFKVKSIDPWSTVILLPLLFGVLASQYATPKIKCYEVRAAVPLIIFGMAAFTSLSRILSLVTFLFSEWRIGVIW